MMLLEWLTSDGDLGSSVAKLRPSGVEQTILLPKGLDVGVCVSGFGLERHICVRDLGES